MKKIAVVTGASSGMGREAAVQLADQFGWLDEIWLIARREERLSRLRKELPCPSRIFELDLTKQTALSALSAALEEEQPRIVFLVNAAGYGKIGQVGEVSLSEEMGMPDSVSYTHLEKIMRYPPIFAIISRQSIKISSKDPGEAGTEVFTAWRWFCFLHVCFGTW